MLLRDLNGAVRLDPSVCFNLHQLRFKCINAICVEVVALKRRVCFYVSSQK
jgi:hypothetical protein